METILFLFLDTNVFLQCKPLDQLDWSVLGKWNRIDLVISRPVQAEIDSLKDGGNARRSARARAASKIIRELLGEEGGSRELRGRPSVWLSLRHDLRRDESLAGVLDYDERDDQLVGIAHAYQQAHSGVKVKLLTNDTGPMASARAVGVDFVDIPSGWLLHPETDDSERREKALKAEVERLRRAEPAFEITAPHLEELRLGTILQMYQPLTKELCDEFIARLKVKNPLRTDFGPSDVQVRDVASSATSLLGSVKERYEPVSPRRMRDYQSAYDQWCLDCLSLVRSLPGALNKNVARPRLTVRIKNVGSRPAIDALVMIETDGRLAVMVPKRARKEGVERAQTGDTVSLTLPAPPTPPEGVWRPVYPWASPGDILFGHASSEQIAAMQRANSLGLDGLVPNLPQIPQPRNPNGFYLKQGKPGVPTRLISYDCAQWRHAQDAEDFQVEVLCPSAPGKYAGRICVTVHAANLTDPAEFHIAVSIDVEALSCWDKALALIS